MVTTHYPRKDGCCPSVHNRGVWKRHADQIVVHHSSATGSHESSASEDVDMSTESATSEGLPNNEASVTTLPARPSKVSKTVPIPSGSVTEQVSSPHYLTAILLL